MDVTIVEIAVMRKTVVGMHAYTYVRSEYKHINDTYMRRPIYIY